MNSEIDPGRPGEKFSLGALVATSNAASTLLPEDIRSALRRHATGDWGDLDTEDRLANEQALLQGERLFSAYNSATGVRFYVITEWDRSVTTVLLPEDY
jgi:hypothetical protein